MITLLDHGTRFGAGSKLPMTVHWRSRPTEMETRVRTQPGLTQTTVPGALSLSGGDEGRVFSQQRR